MALALERRHPVGAEFDAELERTGKSPPDTRERRSHSFPARRAVATSGRAEALAVERRSRAAHHRALDDRFCAGRERDRRVAALKSRLHTNPRVPRQWVRGACILQRIGPGHPDDDAAELSRGVASKSCSCVQFFFGVGELADVALLGPRPCKLGLDDDVLDLVEIETELPQKSVNIRRISSAPSKRHGRSGPSTSRRHRSARGSRRVHRVDGLEVASGSAASSSLVRCAVLVAKEASFGKGGRA